MRTSPCEGCAAEIGWIRTAAGRAMPVDPKPVVVVTAEGTVVRGYTSHFATCPKAEQFRRRDRPERGGIDAALLAGAMLLLFIVATVVVGVLAVSHRLDQADQSARATEASGRETAAQARTAARVAAAANERMGAHATDLALCRQRTESLRATLDVLIQTGGWPGRVRLPDPPPGWPPWPAIGSYRDDMDPLSRTTDGPQEK